MTTSLPVQDQEPGTIEAERFAAIRAAIDPERREMRHDVLVTGVVETLYRRPEITVGELTRLSCELWCTNSINEPLVERALTIARESNLAVPSTSLDEVERWSLTEQGKAMAAADHKTGALVVEDFIHQVGCRLDDADDDRVTADKKERVARTLMAAITEAMADRYELTGGLDIDRIRPVNLDVKQVLRIVEERTDPKSLRRAAAEVAVAALDPDDDFGNEIVRLLAVGNVLHGFAARRDVPAKPDVTGIRIAIDTSVLVGLAAAPGTVDRNIVEDLIRRTLAAGVEVVVTDHVLEEWDRLWTGAEGEIGATEVVEQLANTPNGRLLKNPFASYFLLDLEDDARLDWKTFERRHRDVRQRLVDAGVNVRAHGNHDETSSTLADNVAIEIRERSKDRSRPRTRGNARVDGQSIAMVDRWRRKSGSTAGFFVSRGTFPGRVYADLTGEQTPIELSPEAWLLFLASICTDDPNERSRVAEMIADSTIRASFFSVAAAYTVEDVIKISQRLCDNGGPTTIEDSRAAMQMDLVSLVSEAEPDSVSLEQRVSAIVQQRQVRATIRLARGQATLDSRIERVNSEARAEVSSANTARKKAEDAAKDAGEETLMERGQRIYWKRTAIAWIPAIVVFLAGSLLVVAGVITAWTILLLLMLGAIHGVQVHEYAGSPARSAGSFFSKAIMEVSLLVLVQIALTAFF